MGHHRNRKETDGQNERERGRGMQCFMKKEDKSLIDVEHVETTGERCCHLSWWTPLNSSFCTFIGMKHMPPTFMYIIPMCLRLITFTKTLPQMSFHKFAIFYFPLGLHPWLLIAGELTDPQLPATASTCARLMQGWVASPVCPTPNKNPGYAGGARAPSMWAELRWSGPSLPPLGGPGPHDSWVGRARSEAFTLHKTGRDRKPGSAL